MAQNVGMTSSPAEAAVHWASFQVYPGCFGCMVCGIRYNSLLFPVLYHLLESSVKKTELFGGISKIQKTLVHQAHIYVLDLCSSHKIEKRAEKEL